MSIVQHCASSGSTIKAVRFLPPNSLFLLHSIPRFFYQSLNPRWKMKLTKCVRWLGGIDCAFRVKNQNPASSPNPNNVLLLLLRCRYCRCCCNWLMSHLWTGPAWRCPLKSILEVYSLPLVSCFSATHMDQSKCRITRSRPLRKRHDNAHQDPRSSCI